MKKLLLVVLVMAMAVGAFAGCSPATEAPSEEAATQAPAEESTPEEEAEEAEDTTAAEETAADESATDDSWERIQERGKFIMGLDKSFPPMGFLDEDGELVGFDIDLARAVAEQMGVEVELHPINWSMKEMELDSGNIDVIWNGYTITDERKEKVLMSEPYMENMQVILVRSDSDIATIADLEGKVVAVQEGSSAQSLLVEEMPEIKDTFKDLVAYTDYTLALLDIDSGQADALAVDLVVADYYMAKKEGQYKILDETLAPEQYGIGFRKGEQAFHDALMNAFAELKANGTAAEISEAWFGRDVTAGVSAG